MGLGAWDCRKCSFQSLCLCLRICNCHCLCICVTLPSLNSSWHELSENVWVWGLGTVRSAAFNLWAKCRGWVVGGPDKRTSWSDLVGVRQKRAQYLITDGTLTKTNPWLLSHQLRKSYFESLERVFGSNLAARVLIVDTFSARAVIWRASTVTPLQKYHQRWR